jgi:hypothetical protein
MTVCIYWFINAHRQSGFKFQGNKLPANLHIVHLKKKVTDQVRYIIS